MPISTSHRLGALGLIAGSALIAGCVVPIRSTPEKFAPQLRFDQDAATFPMSAQDYYHHVIETDLYKEKLNCDVSLAAPGAAVQDCRSRAYHNADRRSIVSGQYSSAVWQNEQRKWVPDGNIVKIPTYYKLIECGKQVRILYWFFYGWQEECGPVEVVRRIRTSYHHGDWERILVTLSEDRSKIAAVTYFQHSGSYTRLAEGGDSDRAPKPGASYEPGITVFGNNHPVVYVGKQQHGSYHNEGGTGAGGVSFCGYFEDYRHNNGNPDLWLNTWNQLVNLDEGKEPWMARDVLPDPNFRWGACEGGDACAISQHPARTSNRSADFCNLKTCEGFVSIATDRAGLPVAGILSEALGGSTSSACFESQCEFHDNQFGWTPIHPGTCSHCPSGYTDLGAIGCWKGLRRKAIHFYGLDYLLSTTDEGLLRSRP